MNFGVIRQEIEKLPDKAGSARELIETIARELVRTVVKRAQVRQWILTFSRTTSHGKEMVIVQVMMMRRCWYLMTRSVMMILQTP